MEGNKWIKYLRMHGGYGMINHLTRMNIVSFVIHLNISKSVKKNYSYLSYNGCAGQRKMIYLYKNQKSWKEDDGEKRNEL